MNGKITYHQQVGYCGKSRCRKCRDGTGHGPYWYSYQTVEGRTIRTYIGKHLPPQVQATVEGMQPIKKISVEREPEAQVRIYTLGQFRMERRAGSDSRDWETVTDALWQHQRVRSLLACLVSNPHRKLGREQIVDMLWPDQSPEMAMGRLDRAVHSLRQIFEPDRRKAATSPLLLTERELLTLANQHNIWLDADAFEQLLIQARNSKDTGERERLIEEAVTLYGGEFLPEERALESTRLRRDALQRAWVGALLELADLRVERQALHNAIEPLDRLLAFDPTNEAAVQRLVKLLAQLGRRGEALRVYNRFQKTLQDEFGIAPLPNTRTLYESLRNSGEKRPTLASAQPATQPTQPTPSSSSRKQGAQSTLSARGVEQVKEIQRPQETQETQETQEQHGIRPQRSPETREVISPAVQIGRVHQSEIVGREQELNTLRDMLQETERTTRFKLPTQKRLASSLALDTQRKPQSALLLGEVGIGKTRLAEEVGREVRKRGWVVAWGRVYSQEGVIPYRLWIEILGKAMEYGVWQRQDVSKRPLLFQPLNVLLPEMQALVPQVTLPSTLPPEQEQLRIWEAALELLTTISAGAPLLIVLDDLQWADSSSQELFAYLARRVYGLPIVIIATCRENELEPKHPLRAMFTDLQRERALTALSLETLSDEQIGTLVSRYPSDPQFPEPLVERIQARAAGNPLFAEELARSASDVLRTAEHTLLPENFPTNLPDTISAVLELRLARLSPECKRLLGKAAVLGGTFEFWLISAMETSTNPNSSEDSILELLEESLRSGMLTEEGIGAQITYQFWHPLLVSHLYEGLSAARRANLHRRAATILRQAYEGRPDEEAAHAATITHHLIHGGAESSLIVRYAELAADYAYTLPAYPDAEKHYRIALDYLDPGLDDHRAYLLESLGECTRIQGKYEEARRHYEQALHVRHHLSTPLADQQQEAQLRAMLLCEIGWTWYDVGDSSKALELYTQSEQVLLDANITKGPVWAEIRLQQSYVSWRQGKYAEAQKTAQQSLELYTESAGLNNQKDIPRIILVRRVIVGDQVNLGRVYVLLGDIEITTGHFKEAMAYLNKALSLFEQQEQRREIAIASCNVGDIYLRRAEYGDAQVILRRSLNIAERAGETPLVSFVYGNLGIANLRYGNLADTQKEFQQALSIAERIHERPPLSLWNSYMTTTLQDQGELERAANSAKQAIQVGRAMGFAPYIGLSLVAIGNLRIAQSFATDISPKHKKTLLLRAQHTLQRALQIEGMEADTRIEAQLLLAQTLFLRGEVAEAKTMVAEVLEEAQNFEMIWLVARAYRLLGDILVRQRKFATARKQYEQARRIFNDRGMKLEHARTVHHYGLLFLHMSDDPQLLQRGLTYLRTARQTFIRCGAILDVQQIDRDIDTYKMALAQ